MRLTQIKCSEVFRNEYKSSPPITTSQPFLAPAVTLGETEGAMDSTSVFFSSSFAYNFVRK